MYRLNVQFSNVFFLQFVIRKLCYALRAEILEEDFFSKVFFHIYFQILKFSNS